MTLWTPKRRILHPRPLQWLLEGRSRIRSFDLRLGAMRAQGYMCRYIRGSPNSVIYRGVDPMKTIGAISNSTRRYSAVHLDTSTNFASVSEPGQTMQKGRAAKHYGDHMRKNNRVKFTAGKSAEFNVTVEKVLAGAPILSPAATIRDEKQALRDEIKRYYESQPHRAVEAMQRARKNGIDIASAQVVEKGIKACVALPRSETDVVDLAFWALDALRAQRIATVSAFEELMRLCAKNGDVSRAVDLKKEFVALNYTFTAPFLASFISLVAKFGKDSHMAECLEAFATLKETVKTTKDKGNAVVSMRVFMSLAERVCNMGRSELALEVLKDLTDSHHDLTGGLCEPLLNAALTVGDAAVLRVLLSWYQGPFNQALLDGQSSRALFIAANSGDPQLGLAAFQMLRSSSMVPTPAHYLDLLRALLAGAESDIVSAIEALQEMEKTDTSCFYPVVSTPTGAARPFDHGSYLSVKTLLVDCIVGTRSPGLGSPVLDNRPVVLSGGKEQLDAVYFALVEQMRASRAAEVGEAPTVPRVMLDALIHSAGRLGQLERAFRIFQETSTLFNLTPDITTHNALLAACAARAAVPITTVFAVFQDIESTFFAQEGVKGSRAADHSFNILLEAMVARKEYRLLHQVVEHMLANGCMAQPKTLRNVAVGLALLATEEGWKQADKVKALAIAQRLGLSMEHLTPEALQQLLVQGAEQTRLPVGFLRRMDSIKQGQIKLAEDAKSRVAGAGSGGAAKSMRR